MATRPLVSIITPFFNAEPYFEEAIESVVAQTYDNWELLLVDDGSTDGSTAISQSYAKQYPGKIIYLEHEGHQNKGKSTSRNLGICEAKGKYIALLDADDVYLPQKLEKQVAILEAQPEAGMVYGPTLYWYSWTGQLKDRWRDRVGRLGVKSNTLIQPPHLLTLYLKNGGTIPCTCGLLVHKALAMEVELFDENIQHLHEDQVFLAKICLKTSIWVEPGCWAKYRQHEASTCYTAVRSGEYHPIKLNPARLAYLKWLGAYLKLKSVTDAYLLKAYQQAVWIYEHPKIARILLLIDFIKWFVSRFLAFLRRIAEDCLSLVTGSLLLKTRSNA